MSISNLLFIDANIYLRFYDSKQSDFKKLMNSLIELRENIFITKQIVNEVNRNKLSVFKQSIDSYKKQIAINNISLPDHLDEAESPQISSWNKDRKSIEQLIETSNHKFDSIIKDVIGNISISQDIVSKKLTPITAKAETPNIETLNKAIKRKELGNPPRKTGRSHW
ncbi:MAG: PIN-like domain-containing protein [Bacteroidota bacterium]|nr:PIN-like domain-containing protein [Bacteroidota bacterium]